LPTLNDDIVRGVIDVRVRNAFAFMIAGLTQIAEHYLQRPIPIVTHSYDYPIPDGRGVLGGFGPLPGPWLQPGFREKGYDDLDANIKVMKTLIDVFNGALDALSNLPQFAHVHHLDLRRTLAADSTYKKDWANELHPTGRGFTAVTNKFASLIQGL
jgi:hypothetical protein